MNDETTLCRCRDCGAEFSDEDTVPMQIQPGADVERGCPKCHSDYWFRLPVKRPSMRAAINAKCKDCIYDPLSGLGTWRQQVEACTVTRCPLWPLRPVSSGKKKD